MAGSTAKGRTSGETKRFATIFDGSEAAKTGDWVKIGPHKATQSPYTKLTQSPHKVPEFQNQRGIPERLKLAPEIAKSWSATVCESRSAPAHVAAEHASDALDGMSKWVCATFPPRSASTYMPF